MHGSDLHFKIRHFYHHFISCYIIPFFHDTKQNKEWRWDYMAEKTMWCTLNLLESEAQRNQFCFHLEIFGTTTDFELQIFWKYRIHKHWQNNVEKEKKRNSNIWYDCAHLNWFQSFYFGLTIRFWSMAFNSILFVYAWTMKKKYTSIRDKKSINCTDRFYFFLLSERLNDKKSP